MRRRHTAEQVACLVVESDSSSSSEDSDSSDESHEPIGLQSVQISIKYFCFTAAKICNRTMSIVSTKRDYHQNLLLQSTAKVNSV